MMSTKQQQQMQDCTKLAWLACWSCVSGPTFSLTWKLVSFIPGFFFSTRTNTWHGISSLLMVFTIWNGRQLPWTQLADHRHLTWPLPWTNMSNHRHSTVTMNTAGRPQTQHSYHEHSWPTTDTTQLPWTQLSNHRHNTVTMNTYVKPQTGHSYYEHIYQTIDMAQLP